MKYLLLLALFCVSCSAPELPRPMPAADRLPGKPVVYVFSGIYCPFCWVAESSIKRLSDVATVKRPNGSDRRELIDRFDIKKIPTFIVVDQHDEEVFRYVGSDGAQHVREFINEHKASDCGSSRLEHEEG